MSHEQQILAELGRTDYRPLKPKALARRLSVDGDAYPEFRDTLKALIRSGRIEAAKNHTVRLAQTRDNLVGVYRTIRGGGGFVRPRPGQGLPPGDIFVKARHAQDAAHGDLVQVKILRAPRRRDQAPEGRIVAVIERAAEQFVGTYRIQGEEGFVRIDGGLFHEPIYVGDAGVKNARDGDKVVVEMLRYPSPEMLGEAVVTEVLGPHGEPRVELLSVIRAYALPVEFSPEALEEARQMARHHETPRLEDRVDLTDETLVTIDPVDARDFDDAISLRRDDKGHWRLGVHIADVATFVPPGSALDREARQRGTSVYFPGSVIPMLPEVLSNGLASLQEGRPRYAKTVWMDFDPEGRRTQVELQSSLIQVTKRLTYEQVAKFFTDPSAATPRWSAKVRELLLAMRELAELLRQRRRKRGFIELTLPVAELEYDADGNVTGAHYSVHDESHRVIEEFMLTANEAVAHTLDDAKVTILRRVHEPPDRRKLYAFAEFVASLGLRMENAESRFELQRIANAVANTTRQHAIHYALLRSLKQATYSPEALGHYAIASESYCHFTSPIRRYPDLLVHQQLDEWLRGKRMSVNPTEWIALGEHCSLVERRAEKAERELVKIKLLDFVSTRVGQVMEMVITDVQEFGFFAEGKTLPVEGLVHIRTLVDDFYEWERDAHRLVGRRHGRTFQLGDSVRCVIWRVDKLQRQLDLRLADGADPPGATDQAAAPASSGQPLLRRKPTATDRPPKKRRLGLSGRGKPDPSKPGGKKGTPKKGGGKKRGKGR